LATQPFDLLGVDVDFLHQVRRRNTFGIGFGKVIYVYIFCIAVLIVSVYTMEGQQNHQIMISAANVPSFTATI